MVNQNVITRNELRERIEQIDMAESSNVGQKIVIKAWKDAKFKQWLFKDGNKAIEKHFGIKGNSKLTFVENSDDVHNLIVCTLCSCYPRRILGVSPDWLVSFVIFV